MDEDAKHANDDFEGGLDAEAASEQDGREDSEDAKRQPRRAENNEARELPSQAAAVHQRLRMDGQKELARG